MFLGMDFCIFSQLARMMENGCNYESNDRMYYFIYMLERNIALKKILFCN